MAAAAVRHGLHRRPRAEAAQQRRGAGLEVHRAADAHRQAVGEAGPGVFVIEDLVIEGLTPQDRPFLTARKITVEVPWWTVVQPEADRRIGRHDRLGHGGRELAERPAQLPEVHPQDAQRRAEPLHDDAAGAWRRSAARSPTTTT